MRITLRRTSENVRLVRGKTKTGATALRSPNSGASTRTWWLRSNSCSNAKRPSRPVVAVPAGTNGVR